MTISEKNIQNIKSIFTGIEVIKSSKDRYITKKKEVINENNRSPAKS